MNISADRLGKRPASTHAEACTPSMLASLTVTLSIAYEGITMRGLLQNSSPSTAP